jgi:hypothetical protein
MDVRQVEIAHRLLVSRAGQQAGIYPSAKIERADDMGI